MATSVVRLSAPAAARQSSFAIGALSALCARPAGAGNACRSAVVAMAKKGKDIRLMITLECTEQKATGVAGISRYTSEKVSEWPSPRDAAEAACCRLATLRGEARQHPGSAGRNASRAAGACRWLSRSAACARVAAADATRPRLYCPLRADAAHASAQNRRNTPGRIELMKYNKYLRKVRQALAQPARVLSRTQYTLHREIKK